MIPISPLDTLDSSAPLADSTGLRDGIVVEPVSFRLSPGVKGDHFLSVARATERAGLAHATTAAQTILPLPAFAPFLVAIAPDSVTMGHLAVAWRMGD